MTPNVKLSSINLTLRLISPNEVAEFQTLICTSPNLHYWIDWCHAEFSQQEANHFISATRASWIQSTSFGFGVYDIDENLMGMVAINECYHSYNMVSIGYWIADKYQRQGVAFEALMTLIQFCFNELKVQRIEIVCHPDNIASQRLSTKCGAQFEGRSRNRYLFDGEPQDGFIYGVIPSDIVLNNSDYFK